MNFMTRPPVTLHGVEVQFCSIHLVFAFINYFIVFLRVVKYLLRAVRSRDLSQIICHLLNLLEPAIILKNCHKIQQFLLYYEDA